MARPRPGVLPKQAPPGFVSLRGPYLDRVPHRPKIDLQVLARQRLQRETKAGFPFDLNHPLLALEADRLEAHAMLALGKAAQTQTPLVEPIRRDAPAVGVEHFRDKGPTLRVPLGLPLHRVFPGRTREKQPAVRLLHAFGQRDRKRQRLVGGEHRLKLLDAFLHCHRQDPRDPLLLAPLVGDMQVVGPWDEMGQPKRSVRCDFRVGDPLTVRPVDAKPRCAGAFGIEGCDLSLHHAGQRQLQPEVLLGLREHEPVLSPVGVSLPFHVNRVEAGPQLAEVKRAVRGQDRLSDFPSDHVDPATAPRVVVEPDLGTVLDLERDLPGELQPALVFSVRQPGEAGEGGDESAESPHPRITSKCLGRKADTV